MHQIQFFLTSFGGRWATLLILVCLAFTNCSDGEPATQQPTPQQPDPDPDTDPDPEIPLIAPRVCDFDLDDNRVTSDGGSNRWEGKFDGDGS